MMILKINGVINDFPITSKFGAIDYAHTSPHTGIDLSMPEGTDIISPVDGVVCRVVDYGSESIGKGVIIKLENGDELILGHLSSIEVNVGDVVSIGQKIAQSGNTGHSTGPHLHIGLKDHETNEFVDPSEYEQIFQQLSNQDVSIWYKIKNMFWSSEITEMEKQKSEVLNINGADIGGLREIGRFLRESKTEGIWYALTGQHFGEWWISLLKNFGFWILENSDVFFLFPSFLILVLTFFMGRNRFSRFAIPLFFVYFIARIFFIISTGRV